MLFGELIEQGIAMEAVGKCLGSRIGKITLSDCADLSMLEKISNILTGIIFKRLTVKTRIISDEHK